MTKSGSFKLLDFDFVLDTSDAVLNTCARLGFLLDIRVFQTKPNILAGFATILFISRKPQVYADEGSLLTFHIQHMSASLCITQRHYHILLRPKY